MNRYKIFSTEIVTCPSLSRRESERKAVGKLQPEGFGNGVELEHDEHGAPYIKYTYKQTTENSDTYISISHSSDTCLLAVSDTPIGIDIESGREQLKRVAKKFLTPDEQKRLSEIASENEIIIFLLKTWTAKEAVFKAASLPKLVISEIEINPEFNQASAQGYKFDLTYPLVSKEKTIAIATRG